MDSAPLYTSIYQSLSYILPKDIINFVIIEYVIEKYEYMRTIKNDIQFTNVHYNKQMKILFCASISGLHYKIIDCHDLNSAPCNKFLNTHLTNIIYYNNKIMLTHITNHINKYDFINNQYVYSDYSCQIRAYQDSYVHNNYLYVLRESRYYTYKIIIYDIDNLTIIRQSEEYAYDGQSRLQMTINLNKIYVYELVSGIIYIHDRNTLRLTKQSRYKSNYETVLYKDKIYRIECDVIYIYDIETLELTYVLISKSFINRELYVRMTINDDVIMLSNEQETIFYEIK